MDLEREVEWDSLKREIARKEVFFKCEGLSAKASIGHAFVPEIHRVVKELKDFYEGPARAKKKSTGLVADGEKKKSTGLVAEGEKQKSLGLVAEGDPQAFVKFFDKFHGFVKKCSTSVSL